jgi:hypothetical protein
MLAIVQHTPLSNLSAVHLLLLRVQAQFSQ